MSTETTTRRRGPAADPTVRTRVLDAFLDEIAERGLTNTSVDDIAARAEVSKVTLYKRWPTRNELVIAGFDLLISYSFVIDSAISAEENLRTMVARVNNDRDFNVTRQLLAEVLTASGYDDEERDRLRARCDSWNAFITQWIEYGQRTGEIPADRNVERLARVIGSVIVYGHLTGHITDRSDLADFVWSLATADSPF